MIFAYTLSEILVNELRKGVAKKIQRFSKNLFGVAIVTALLKIRFPPHSGIQILKTKLFVVLLHMNLSFLCVRNVTEIHTVLFQARFYIYSQVFMIANCLMEIFV